MSRTDRRWGELFAITVGRVSTTVEEMHRAIALPWFRLAGPAAPALVGAYAGAVSRVYRTVRKAASGVGAAIDGIGSSHPPANGAGPFDAAQALANALWGDDLAHRGSAIAVAARLRDRSGGVVELDARSLARSFPDATPRLAVLLHGLGQTEQRFLRSSSSGVSLLERLDASTFTPILIRYNSGSRVADTGEDLAAVIADLVEAWPVPVTEIAVVGYSMGGLVGRAAVDAAATDGLAWAGAVRHVVTIATPHAGSPIESGAVAVSRALALAPQSRPLGKFIADRSGGMRDLRSGGGPALVLEGTVHHRIAGVVTSDPSHPLGALVGDLVVRPASASGRTDGAPGERVVIGGRRHDNLLDDESVARHVLRWLEPGTQ